MRGLWQIAPNLVRSSGRRFLLKRPETGLSPGLISITPKWVSSLALWSRILSWDRFSHRACSLASCAEVVFAVGWARSNIARSLIEEECSLISKPNALWSGDSFHPYSLGANRRVKENPGDPPTT